MINEPLVTIHGNLTDEPSMRAFDSGSMVTEFTVAQNPRYRDSAGEWQDGEAIFLRVKAYRQMGETAAQDLKQGYRVTVTGRLRRRSWTDKESGQKRYIDEIQADDVAVSLQGQRVRVAKIVRDPSATPPAEANQG